jgi:hypothetical protein
LSWPGTWGNLGYSTLGGLPVAYHGSPALTYSYNGLPAVTYSAAPAIVAPVATKTQYHAQDELGQASYGYAHPGQAAAETRDAFGNVRGSYAYIDPNGKEVRVNYVADAGGFRAESNALPVAPAVPAAPELVGPAPVQDLPEVVEARAAHARAYEAAAKAAAEQPERRKKRAAILASPLGLGYTAVAAPALTYGAPAVAYASPLTYAAHPLTYAAAPVAYNTLGLRPAILTTVHNNPGHAVSYRVD